MLSASSAASGSFAAHVASLAPEAARARRIRLLELNVGLRCNMACTHCQHACSPSRSEIITSETFTEVVRAAASLRPGVVDLTGGAPELHPEIRSFIAALTADGHTVQLRTNLTSLLLPEAQDLPAFFAKHQVRLVASLPGGHTDDQRGSGAFSASIESLLRLNAEGYGLHAALPLDLVHNPDGPWLPRPEPRLQREYRMMLSPLGVVFGRVLAMTNMPVGRFRQELAGDGRLHGYVSELRKAFNADTLLRLPCREQIEVAWDGSLWDCDFNLAAKTRAIAEEPGSIARLSRSSASDLHTRAIAFAEHCWGCAAASGSS